MAIPEPGAVFLGRFAVESVVGKGGMGVVLRARDRRLRRAVAIKFLTVKEAGAEVMRQRFLREARAAAGLSHPGVIQVFDVGETDDGDAYVVMEFVEGVTLRAVLEAGVMPSPERARVVAEAARALAAAHRVGLVHRDVKPDNVMVRDDGRAVVLDFGIARRTLVDPEEDGAPDVDADGAHDGPAPHDPTLTQPGAILGTPAYFSPEQVASADVDARADQFALGVTAFELFSSKLPWRQRKPAALLGEIATRDAPPLSSAWKDAPPGLDAVLARALDRDPDARYPDLDAFADALEPFARASAVAPAAPAPAAPAPAPESLSLTPNVRPRPTPRPPASWRRAAAAGAFAAAAALAAGLAVKSRRDASAVLVRDPSSSLACVPFAPAAPGDGWLGAAAAAGFCRRAEVMLGGDPARALPPAELVDLPRALAASMRGAYDGDARARAVRAARARATVWADGAVRHDGADFHLSVTLRRADGGAVARASAKAPLLVTAARRLTEALADEGALPREGPLAPVAAEVSGVRERAALLAWTDFEWEEWLSRGELAGRCREPSLARYGGLAALVRAECGLLGVTPRGAPVAVDRSSPGALARTARYHVVTGGTEDPSALAEALRAARTSARGPVAAALAEAEAEMAQTLGQGARARELALVAVGLDPRDWVAWGRLVSTAVDGADVLPLLGAYAAWNPDSYVGWRWLGADWLRGAARSPEERREWSRRAYVLSPDAPVVAVQYGRVLAATGDPEGARGVAARLRASGGDGERAAAAVDVAVATCDARFGRALDLALSALTGAPARDMGSSAALLPLMDDALELGAILGREAEVADRLAAAFLADGARIERFGALPLRMAAWCAAASPAAAAACRARLDGLIARRHFLALTARFDEAWRGVGRAVDGDAHGAAEAWRPLVRDGDLAARVLRAPMARAFEAAGEPDLADALDEAAADERPRWGGATRADASLARRAAARGDLARARALAERVARAWQAADRVPPAVAEMRAILSRR